jgi:hypothetical protein
MPALQEPSSKVARYRERLRDAGLRPVQFWVTDTRSPELAAQLRSQCLALKGDPSDADAVRFTEEAASHIEGWE